MSDNFFVNSPFNISQDAAIYTQTSNTPNAYDYIFTINTYDVSNSGSRFDTMNTLFNVRHFQQNAAGQHTAGENNFDVDLQLNRTKLTDLLYSNDCVGITSLQTDITNNAAYNTLTSSEKLLGLRFLEVVATKVFGHAKARAAIENDSEFYANTSGSLIRQISDGVQNAFNEKKGDVFNMYVSFDRIQDNSNNDVDTPSYFNFQHTSWEFPILLKSTLVGMGDMTELNLGPYVGGNRLTAGSMAVPILLKFITNNSGSPNIPLFTLLGLEFINSLVNDFSISINSLGNRIAVGIVNNTTNSGIVRAYEYKYSSWTQLGDDIVGELSGDKSGYSISMNDMGDCIAIGASNNNGYNGTNSGQVRVYKLNVKTASPLEYKWDKLGQDIDGAVSNLLSGYSVSMNSLGNCIAIGSNNTNSGCIRTYICVNNIWLKLGADLDTEYIGITSKYLVNMNSLGNRIAVGTINSGVGCVKVYEYNAVSYSWVQLGTNMFTTLGDSNFSVSINGLGDRVVVGYNSTLGSIKIYNYVSTDWVAMTQIINLSTNNLCYSVSIDSTGNRITIGAVNSNTKLGNTILYKYETGQWNEALNIIDTVVNDSLKYSVNMSDSGNYIAQGAVYSSDGSCHVKVLQITDTSTYTPVDYPLFPNRFKLGLDINGLIANELLGGSVSMNSLGNRVAITSNHNNIGLCQIKVFEFNILTSLWDQLGDTITYTFIYDRVSISMNSLGNCIIIGMSSLSNSLGIVQVYTFINDIWKKLGQELTGIDVWEKLGQELIGIDVFGYSVSINSIGNRIAVSAPKGIVSFGDYSFAWGYIKIYEYNMNSDLWDDIGHINNNGTVNELFGSSISMNSIGDRIVIGCSNSKNDSLNGNYVNGNNNGNQGNTRVYKLIGTNTWDYLGQILLGESYNENSGFSVSMNGDGDQIIIGAPFNIGNGALNSNRGQIRVYKLNGNIWEPLGQYITGIINNGGLGYSTSMNNTGDRIIVGAPGLTSGVVGRTTIYKLEITNTGGIEIKTWIEMMNIDNKFANDKSGWSVSMNSYGDRIAIGAIRNDDTLLNSGQVRVFQIVDTIIYYPITIYSFPDGHFSI